MKAVKKKKKSIFLRIAFLAFSLYVIITLVQLQMEIGNKKKQLDAVQENILLQQQLNGDLKSKLENPDEYIEQEARDQNMVKPGEIVMQEVLGELKDIAARDGISCACGSHQWRLDVHFCSIEVICAECGAAIQIPAATADDIDNICCRSSIFIKKM